MNYITDFECKTGVTQLETYAYLFEDNINKSMVDKIQTCMDALQCTEGIKFNIQGTEFVPKAIKLTVKESDEAGKYIALFTMKLPDNADLPDIEELTFTTLIGYDNCVSVTYSVATYLIRKLEILLSLKHNCNVLADYVNTLMKTTDSKNSTFEFAPRNKAGIFNLTDNHIGIYLDYETVSNLNTLMYLGSDAQQENLNESILATFQNLPCMLEAVRRKTLFSQNLKFYTWKKAKTIFRSTYHRDITKLHNGVGYYTEDGFYALLINKTCSSQELTELKEQYAKFPILTGKNTNPCSSDYYVAKDTEQLQTYIDRCKRHNRDYEVIEVKENNQVVQYKVIYRLYTAKIVLMQPINLDTYEKRTKQLDTSILDY